ncbi:hypothetical protein CRUP_034729 [Coryphaenoides rupestris]|nr:hypothetical protein CRUP_034729 [Coryphaenoides rupestris]
MVVQPILEQQRLHRVLGVAGPGGPAGDQLQQELDTYDASLYSAMATPNASDTLTSTSRLSCRHGDDIMAHDDGQEALLAAISEKDANIALLELSSSKKKKTQEEVAALKREKDGLVHQLKQQTQNRMKLMADNYEDEHLKMIPPLLDLHQNRSKMKLYIGHLTSLCQERDPIILRDFLEAESELCEREGAELQEYANQVLQQIADRCPDILEQVVNALEETC